MAKKSAAKSASKSVPKGWRRIERKLRPFWVPQERDKYPEQCVRSTVIEGVVAGFRKLTGGKFNKERLVMDIDADNGMGVTVELNGNLQHLVKDANLGEGETVRIEYLGFTEPGPKAPMGRHEYDLLVAVPA